MDEAAFTVDMVLNFRQPTIRVPMHASPDGSKLAISSQSRRRAADLDGDESYTAQGVPKEMVGSCVLVVDTDTGEVREPFPVGSTSWGGQWSPDGTKLAAYLQDEGPACLAVWEPRTETFRAYRDARVRPFFGFEVPRWTPDSGLVVVKLHATPPQERDEDRESSIDTDVAVSVFSFDPADGADTTPLPGWADGYRCDLGAISVDTGEVRRLAADWSLIGWKVSPDGSAVAVLRYTEAAQELQQFYYDLTVVPFNGGDHRVVARRVPQDYGVSFNWSPGGDRIAYTTEERGQLGKVFVVAADGEGEPLDLSDPGGDMELTGGTAEPRWSPEGDRVYCRSVGGHWELSAGGGGRRRIRLEGYGEVMGWVQSPGSSILWTPSPGALLEVVRDARTGNTRLARVDMGTGRAVVLADLEKGWYYNWDPNFGAEVTPDGAEVYLPLEAADHPPEIWRFAGDFRDGRRLLPFNPDLEGMALGKARLVRYRALDGQRRCAALLLPPGYEEGRTVPVVVDVYGGQLSSHLLHHFGGDEGVLNNQLLAGRGYAVLYPDLPMEDRDPLRQLPGQVLPAVNQLIDEGIADPARIGLMGHSYGGYSALALLVQTGIFRAAVASAGFYDLVGSYGAMRENGTASWLGWAESGQGRMGGSLWEKRDAYIENSPIFYLDRVTTPLLLVCGSEDIVPPAQAEAVFVGLRRLGKRVELRRYEGESHWPGVWSERSYRDLCERVTAWFDDHLAP